MSAPRETSAEAELRSGAPSLPPLALYVHIPWCVQKCPYCDFNSHSMRGAVPEVEYVAALLRDLDFELHGVGYSAETNGDGGIASTPERRPLTSIFFGGGTPSVFSAQAIGAILGGVARRLAFAPGIEITLEANPGTVEAARFAGYRAAGVNRLSMGVQSLDDAKLAALGRIHGAAEAVAAVGIARAAGFDNLNLDLMFALPQQTIAEAAVDLRRLLALAPEHVSYYHLTLEPNTAFHRAPPAGIPDGEDAYAMLEAGMAQLADAGYAQYETSAYARPARPAAHNLNYWRFGDYLGIGAGAHGKRTAFRAEASATGGGAPVITRRARHKHPRTYMERAGSAAALQEERVLGADELPIEFCMNALRLHEGFSPAQFEARTGLPLAAMSKPLRRAANKGLLTVTADRIAPTPLGRAHLNALLLEFMP